MVYYTKHLAHHGILGMKWGQKNGPPYPIGASGHSASERKAGWRQSLNKQSSSSSSKKNGLSDKQKKNLKTAVKVGAVVAATALVAYGGYKISQSEEIRSAIFSGKRFVQNLPSDSGSSENLKVELDFNKALSNRNPTGNKHNCKMVALAVAKAKNGDGDFYAEGKSFEGNLTEFMESVYDNASSHLKYVESVNGTNAEARTTKKILKSFSEGDVGIVSLEFDKKYLVAGAEESAHAFNWEIKDGAVVYGDGQPAYVLTDCSEFFKSVNPSKEIEIAKIDGELHERPGELEKHVKKR